MIKIKGSQRRENYKDAGYELVSLDVRRTAILRDETGKRELWSEQDDYAGDVIEINGLGYKFVRSLS